MIFGIFVLLVAVIISAVSAFYSVTGLTAIFASAFWPVVIMGSALELGKVTATVWLHTYWSKTSWQFKFYLVPAIVILMFITSMGTYGFLAKAHSDHSVPLGDVTAKINIIDTKISTAQDAIQVQQDNIQSAKTALAQLDAQVNEMLSRSTSATGANRAYNTRKRQAQDRKALQDEISQAQSEINNITLSISSLREERAPIASEVRQVEAEVGPIRYIANLIYGDNPDDNLLEKSVRYVIILIVVVFDPLALALILAGEQTIRWHYAEKVSRREEIEQPQPNEDALLPTVNDDNDDITDNNLEEDKKPKIEGTADEPLPEKIQLSLVEEPPRTPELTANSEVEEEVGQPEITETLPEVTSANSGVYDPSPLRNKFNTGQYSQNTEDKPIPNADTNFGFWFPENPKKGDTFVRTNYVPHKLYKFNDKEWIEVDKQLTEEYTFNEEYIKHLVEMIDKKHYDVDLLTTSEQEQIEKYLNEQINK